MQPHYLPYSGFFAMLDSADVCVLLDVVPLSKQSWQTRNRIRARDGETVWLSVPVHAHMGQPLNEVRIDNTRPWQRKHWRTIQAAYGHTSGWELIEQRVYLGAASEQGLSAMTGDLIKSLAHMLGITTPIIHASDLHETRDDKAGRIVDLCHQVEADTYLSTTGAAYLQDQDLEGISVEWFDYQHPTYPQGTMEWQPYLSILDLIAHSATDSLSVIRSTYDQPCETRKESETN